VAQLVRGRRSTREPAPYVRYQSAKRANVESYGEMSTPLSDRDAAGGGVPPHDSDDGDILHDQIVHS
jgi:hypothetical protein